MLAHRDIGPYEIGELLAMGAQIQGSLDSLNHTLSSLIGEIHHTSEEWMYQVYEDVVSKLPLVVKGLNTTIATGEKLQRVMTFWNLAWASLIFFSIGAILILGANVYFYEYRRYRNRYTRGEPSLGLNEDSI